jgi:hypothetical protein
MRSSAEEQRMLIGFLAFHETLAGDGHIGAILVTDSKGIPQEFRCTHPVKPTAIQKPLYGDTLEPYIGVNLCGIPLVESIQNKPSLIVVNKELLIDIRASSSYPVVFVRRAGEAIDISSAEGSGSGPKRERLDCPSGRFQPIVFIAHPDFDEDRTFARGVLEEIFDDLDPIEPFGRIQKAIEILSNQDDRFK